MGTVAGAAGWHRMGVSVPGGPTSTTWGDGAGSVAIAASAPGSGFVIADLVPIEMPAHGNIESVEVHLTTIAGGATALTIVAYRDSNGDDLFISNRPTSATQDISTAVTTAAEGGVVWKLDKDHHPVTITNASISTVVRDTTLNYEVVRLWFGFYLNVGTAVVDRIIVNWRAAAS